MNPRTVRAKTRSLVDVGLLTVLRTHPADKFRISDRLSREANTRLAMIETVVQAHGLGA